MQKECCRTFFSVCVCACVHACVSTEDLCLRTKSPVSGRRTRQRKMDVGAFLVELKSKVMCF